MSIRDIPKIALLALGAASCGGTAAQNGNRRPVEDAVSGADRARTRIALQALEKQLGHGVDFSVDAALVENDRGASAHLAEVVEGFVYGMARLDPRSDRACHPIENCRGSYQLSIQANSAALMSSLRAVQLRYDVQVKKRADPTFDASSGTLVFRVPPDASFSQAVDLDQGFQRVIHDTLAARFANRSGASVAPAELPAYVLFLTRDVDPTFQVVELAGIYGRLAEPARGVAEGILSFTELDPRQPETNTPRIRAAWVAWYRAFASTLEAKELLRVAPKVFPPVDSMSAGTPAPEELPGLPAFDYAWSLLQAQAHGHPSPESALFACAKAPECSSPLFQYFVWRNATARRQRLSSALIAARDPALTQFVLVRLFQQRDSDAWRHELLDTFFTDPGAWSVAVASSMIASNGMSGDQLVEIWRGHPNLRDAMLEAAARAGANGELVSPGARVTGETRHALLDMAQSFCRGPERADFIARFRKYVPEQSSLWIGSKDPGRPHGPCDEIDRY